MEDSGNNRRGSVDEFEMGLQLIVVGSWCLIGGPEERVVVWE